LLKWQVLCVSPAKAASDSGCNAAKDGRLMIPNVAQINDLLKVKRCMSASGYSLKNSTLRRFIYLDMELEGAARTADDNRSQLYFLHCRTISRAERPALEHRTCVSGGGKGLADIDPLRVDQFSHARWADFDGGVSGPCCGHDFGKTLQGNVTVNR